MGPRLALSIWTATRELERIVGGGEVGEVRWGVGERERGRGSGSGWVRDWDGREREREGEDVVMGGGVGGGGGESESPVLSSSWVVVPGEDWEMVDCSA